MPAGPEVEAHTEEGGAKGERGKVSRCHLQRPECHPPGPLPGRFLHHVRPREASSPAPHCHHTRSPPLASGWGHSCSRLCLPPPRGAKNTYSSKSPQKFPKFTPCDLQSWLVSPHTGYEQWEPGLLRPDPCKRVCRRPPPSPQTPGPLPADARPPPCPPVGVSSASGRRAGQPHCKFWAELSVRSFFREGAGLPWEDPVLCPAGSGEVPRTRM